MLYILTSSPNECDFTSLLRLLRAEDDLLLIQDGVYAAMDGAESVISLSQSHAAFYVLQEDVAARGITRHISKLFQVVGYDRFVELTVKHPQQITW